MRWLLVSVAALGAAFPCAMAEAAEALHEEVVELTADAAVREALAANRELQAASERIAIARGRRLQAGRLDNPELELAYADDFAFAGDGERTSSIGLEQRVPITSRLAREREVATQDVAVAEAEVRDAVRVLIAEVQRSFYAVRALDERIAVSAELVSSVRRVEQATARRLQAAEVSPAEVGLLRIERLRLEQEARRLAREREVAVAELTRLLGRSPPDAIAPIGELDPGPLPPREVSHAGVGFGDGKRRPDLEAARRAVARAGADLELARSEVWEDWTVSFGYERDRQTFDDAIPAQEDSALMLDVRVPVPLWNRQEGRIAAAEAERRRARRSREALALRIDEQIRAAEARVTALRASVDAYAEELLPELRRSQELFERGYRQGLLGVAELLQAQRQYNESRILRIDLLSDLRQAAIELEAATAASPYLDAMSLDSMSLDPMPLRGGNTP